MIREITDAGLAMLGHSVEIAAGIIAVAMAFGTVAAGCLSGCASGSPEPSCPMGSVKCGASLCCPSEQDDAGRSGLDTPPVPPETHCDRCLSFYFNACSRCTCWEVDSGTLVQCGACPDGMGNTERDALYSCVGVQ